MTKYQVVYGTTSIDRRAGFVVSPYVYNTLEEATKERRSFARRGFTAWVQTYAFGLEGEFVPVKGAMRRPKGYEQQL